MLVICALKMIQMSISYVDVFTPPFKVFFGWLCLEAAILVSALLSNAAYLIARSFRRQQTELQLKKDVCHVESDVLEARQIEVSYFNSWLTPFFICLFIRLAALLPVSEKIEPHLEPLLPLVESLMLLFFI